MTTAQLPHATGCLPTTPQTGLQLVRLTAATANGQTHFTPRPPSETFAAGAAGIVRGHDFSHRQDEGSVADHGRVTGKQTHGLRHRLREQDAIKRISVNIGQSFNGSGMTP